MTARLSDRLQDLLAETPRAKLYRLYRAVERGDMGSGERVAELRRAIVGYLNGPRRQHARRLFQRSFQALMAESPIVLQARRRPPWLLHRRESDALWAAVAALAIPKLAAHTNTRIHSAARETPLEDVLAGPLAQGLEEQIRKAAAAGLRRLRKNQRKRFAAFFGEGGETGTAPGVPARVRLGAEHVEMVAAMVATGPVVTPMAERVVSASYQADSDALAETVVAATAEAAQTLRALHWPEERAAMVALAVLYRGHAPLAAAKAAAHLPGPTRAAVYEGVCCYLQGAAAQFNTDLLSLLEGGTDFSDAGEALWRIEADQAQLAASTTALAELPPAWRALGVTRSLFQAAASAFKFLQAVLPVPLREETEAAVATEVRRYTSNVLPQVAEQLNNALLGAGQDSETVQRLPALHWLLRLTMTLRDLPSLPAEARRPLVRWQRSLGETLIHAWHQILASTELSSMQRLERLGHLLSLGATLRQDMTELLSVADTRLTDTVTRVLLLELESGPAAEAVIAAMIEASEAELARNPSYQDPNLTELLTAAIAAGRRTEKESA